MKKLHRILFLALLLTATIITLNAQNTGGKFKGGGSSSGAYSPNGSLVQLLRDPNVMEELKLSSQQIETMEQMIEKLNAIELKLRNHNTRLQSETSFPALIEQANQEMHRIEPLLWDLLDQRQRTQIPEVQIKQLGADALLLKPVETFLKITPDQRKRLLEIQNESRLQAVRATRPDRQRPDRSTRRSFRSADGRSGFSSGTSSFSPNQSPDEQNQNQTERQRIIHAGHERMIREVLTESQQATFRATQSQTSVK